MKVDLKTLATKKYIALKAGAGYYKPTDKYLVMHDETVITYITYEADEGKWRAEDMGGGDYVMVKPDQKVFDVYQKLT